MRIIAGEYKKRKLVSIKKSVALRATSDKVKEALFDIIGEKVKDSKFLDLFSGSGNIGVEAISRGARFVCFVEQNKTNLKILKENIKNLSIENSRYEIVFSDVFRFLNNYNKNLFFDVIFMDPPYNKRLVEKTIFSLKNFKGIHDETLIIAETSINESFEDNEIFELTKKKKYGDTNICFFGIKQK